MIRFKKVFHYILDRFLILLSMPLILLNGFCALLLLLKNWSNYVFKIENNVD